MARVALIILDSLGVGGAPDAGAFGDQGANTMGHIALYAHQGLAEQGRNGPLCLPTLTSLGLGLAAALSTGQVPPGLELEPENCLGQYGCATPTSPGKDTISGHFELAGVPITEDWGYFTAKNNSIPKKILDELIQHTKIPGFLGNCQASGTEILVRLGEEHITSGKPIIYTSADSVLQIAAHETYFGLSRLYALCLAARTLVDEYRIARVIARPFIGENKENFVRTGQRRDYAMPAPQLTILDRICQAGGQVVAIGKVRDIFAGRGVSQSFSAHGHAQIMDQVLLALAQTKEQMAEIPALLIANFVDFDSVYGHRRDVAGYARALEAFDENLPRLLKTLEHGDLCIITADHGCDPTWPGTDHTREQVPILAFGPGIKPGSIGIRQSFSDVAATIALFLDLNALDFGSPFLLS